MPPLLCMAFRPVFSEYTLRNRWTVSGVKNDPPLFLGELDRWESAAPTASIFLASSFSGSHVCLRHSAGKQSPRPPQRPLRKPLGRCGEENCRENPGLSFVESDEHG
jgi:hypothetical protein